MSWEGAGQVERGGTQPHSGGLRTEDGGGKVNTE